MVAPLALMGLSVAADLVGSLMTQAGGGGASGAGDVAGAAGAAKKAKLKATANDFEKMFLEQALDRLTESNGPDGPLGQGGTGGSVYRSMMVKEYAGSIVKSGGVGISDQVYRQMLQIQEGAARGG